MASILTSSAIKCCCSAVSAITLMFLVAHLPVAECKVLIVGGDVSWATPPAKEPQFYNDWASRKRFQVNDTLRFQYNNDSVMVVTDGEEYEQCRSSHPMFFANNGDTVFTLDRPGLFYFISGIYGHCRRGLKMVVKVLEPQGAADHSSPTSPAASTSAPAAEALILIPVVVAISSVLLRL